MELNQINLKRRWEIVQIQGLVGQYHPFMANTSTTDKTQARSTQALVLGPLMICEPGPFFVTSKNVFLEGVLEAACPKKCRLVKSVISRNVLNQIPQNEVA